MPDYLADRFASWMGWGPSPDNRSEGVTPNGKATGPGGAGWAWGKPKFNGLGQDPDIYNDAGAGGGRSVYGNPQDLLSPASSLRMLEAREGGPEEQKRRIMARQPDGMAALDAARFAPVTPGPPAHGTSGWMPPSERGGAGVPRPMSRQAAPQGQAPPMNPQGAGQPMPQAAAGGQPQPLLPSGARPNFLGRARDWLGGEAFPAGQSMSRGMVLAQALGNFGAGLSATGRVGTGLQMANKGMWDARAGERKFRQEEVENRYKTMTAEAQLAKAMKPTAGNSSPFERQLAEAVASGQMTQEDAANLRQQWLTSQATEGTAARTFEGVLMDPNASPELKAQAKAGLEAKRAADPEELKRLELAEKRDRRAEEAAIRAEQAGNLAAAASIRQENAALRKEEQDLAAAGVGLRKEYNSSPEVKAYRSVLPAIESAIESAGRNDRISDIDLVFALGKTFDPNSVVRESEQGMILDAQGVPDWVHGAINRLTGEAGLQPEVRKQILTTLKSRAKGLRKAAEQQHSQYTGYARDSRLDPGRVIPGLEELPELPDVPGGGGSVPGIAPAAADEHGTVPLGNLPTFDTPGAVDEAVAAGRLRSGDKFKDVGGNVRTVP